MSKQATVFQVGDAAITRIVETRFPMAFDALYPGSVERLQEARERGVLAVDCAPDQPITLSVHSWLLETNGLKILIDTGIGNHKSRPFNALFHQRNNPFLERLAEAGVTPEHVDYVLLTHLHTDHVGWNTRFVDGQWLPTFPRAKYVLPKTELEFFFTPAGDKRRMLFDDSILPIICANQAIVMADEGGEILPGISYAPAPGHSAGHMMISLRSGGAEAIFAGDTLHSPLQVACPDWNSVFCLDPQRALASRLKVLQTAAARNALLLPAHFPETSAGYVTRHPGGYTWRYEKSR